MWSQPPFSEALFGGRQVFSLFLVPDADGRGGNNPMILTNLTEGTLRLYGVRDFRLAKAVSLTKAEESPYLPDVRVFRKKWQKINIRNVLFLKENNTGIFCGKMILFMFKFIKLQIQYSWTKCDRLYVVLHEKYLLTLDRSTLDKLAEEELMLVPEDGADAETTERGRSDFIWQ